MACDENDCEKAVQRNVHGPDLVEDHGLEEPGAEDERLGQAGKQGQRLKHE